MLGLHPSNLVFSRKVWTLDVVLFFAWAGGSLSLRRAGLPDQSFCGLLCATFTPFHDLELSANEEVRTFQNRRLGFPLIHDFESGNGSHLCPHQDEADIGY